MLLSEGQMNDHKGAGLLIDALPPAREPLADRGYDSDGFRVALVEKGITPASRRARTARSLSHMKRPSAASAIASSIPSAA